MKQCRQATEGFKRVIGTGMRNDPESDAHNGFAFGQVPQIRNKNSTFEK